MPNSVIKSGTRAGADALYPSLRSQKPMTIGGYDPSFYEALFAAEDRHFWFRSRNRVIAKMASQAVDGLNPGYRVLELGCGNGNVIRFLQSSCSAGIVVGMDLFAEGLHYAKLRGASRLVQGDVAHAPFAEKFHLIGMFDVLEHIADDRIVLQHVFDLLTDNGVLLLTVPAHRTLWSYFDEASHHCRRYEIPDLAEKLLEAGFQIEYLSQYMASLFPLMLVKRRFLSDRVATDSTQLAMNELQINPTLNSVMNGILHCEERLLAKHIRLPIGTSIIALARKTSVSEPEKR